MTSTRFPNVHRFLLGTWGALVHARNGLFIGLGASGDFVQFMEPTTDLCFAQGGSGIVVASGQRGRVARIFHSGGPGRVEWPQVGATVTALAVGDDGRIAVGTADERLLIGAARGTWALELQLERVAPPDSDLWSPCTRGVGFLSDGSVVAVAGTGHVHVVARNLKERSPFRLEELAYADTARLLSLTEGRMLFLHDTEAIVIEADGRIVSRYPATSSSRDLLAHLHQGNVTVLTHSGALSAQWSAPAGARSVDLDEGIALVGCTDGSLHWLAGDSGELLDVRQASSVAVGQVQSTLGLVGVLGVDGDLLLTDTPHLWPVLSSPH